jgi:rhamnogalacturonyl hydrolase YesR
MSPRRLRPTVIALLFLIPAGAAPLAAQTPVANPPPIWEPGTNPLPAPGQAPEAPLPPRRYPPMPADEIRTVLARVRGYLEVATPIGLVDRDTRTPITDYSTFNPKAELVRGDFRLVSYEWGVTYAAMLHAAEVTGETSYRDYVADRLKFITEVAPAFRGAPPDMRRNPFRAVNEPRSLDDSGAMAAAFIKAARADIHTAQLRPFIDRYLTWITQGQKRLPDGTLARDRPLHDALWLDDLYMSVPALAQMGVLTGESRYFDDAARQIIQFHQRMFVPAKGLFMHGWIQDMDPHPVFHWGRANGWAIVAATELLSVMPEDHPQRGAVLAIYRAHAAGLAACQGGSGLWHQLLDRTDSYPETSATAMFVYSIARGINRGWLQPLAYGPAVSLGWNAVARQVNARGEVLGTCVGTGMGFEPAFYYERPTSTRAAHGYGPVLHAGAEMITLYAGKGAEALVSDGAVQFQPSPSRH